MNKNIMRAAGLDAQVDLVESGHCPVCGKSIDDKAFTNELSRREFAISGLCQVCQNDIFCED